MTTQVSIGNLVPGDFIMWSRDEGHALVAYVIKENVRYRRIGFLLRSGELRIMQFLEDSRVFRIFGAVNASPSP